MQHPFDALHDVILPLLERRQYRIFPQASSPGPHSAENYIEAYSHDRQIHNHYEWMWLISGAAHMKIQGEVYHLAPGDFCFLPPQVPHADVYDRNTPAYESLWFTYSPGRLNFTAFSYQPFGQQEIQSYGGAYAAAEIGTVLVSLQNEIARRGEFSQTLVHGLMLQLAALLLRTVNASRDESGGAVSSRVLEFLELHHTRELSLAEIARSTFLTPNYLTAVFKRETGQTIFEALAHIRVEHATRLILENQMPLAQIAAAVGYNSADRFSRVFRQVKGVAPKFYGKASK